MMQFKSTHAAPAPAHAYAAWQFGRRQARRWVGFSIVCMGLAVAYGHVVEAIVG